jgi:TonB family protein
MTNYRGYFRLLALATGILAFAGRAGADDPASTDQQRAAREMYNALAKLSLHKIYVPDFVDTEGKRTGASYYLAATFSKLLADDAKELAVLGRVDAHDYLKKNGWSDADLANHDVASNLAAEFGVDGILSGVFSTAGDSYTLDFTARDLSGKALFRAQYRYNVYPVLRGILLSAGNEPGPSWYFPLLDGVSQPKCKHCPPPDFTNAARAKGTQGMVLLSVLVTSQGTADHIYVVQSDVPDLEQNSVNGVKKWKFEPCRDSSGAAVAARVPVQVAFRLFGRPQ